MATGIKCVLAVLRDTCIWVKGGKPMSLYIPENFYEATLPLSALYRDPALQVRTLAPFGKLQIRPEIITHYRELYEDGKDLGPLAVVEEIDETGAPTNRLLLADGHHRFEALKQLGRATVPCKVYRGDEFTAVLLAARENGGRGLSFDPYNRKHVVRRLLITLAEQGTTWSNQEIADHVGVDYATVRTVRADLKKSRGWDILDAFDEPTLARRTLPPDERPRWNPNQGYIQDPLLDNLPGADEPILPALPHQGRAKRGPGKRRR
jgi:hypothetical protein